MKHASRLTGQLLALLALGLSAAAADAKEYGAIAFSSQSGAHGYSHNYSSRGAAEQRALSGCRRNGGGCRVVLYFNDACGALAVGDGYGSGYAWGTSRRQAEGRALSNCNGYTSSCQVVRWVCSK
jgi:serine/threonine-protein kinase